MDKELCLFAPFPIRVLKGGLPTPGVDHFPIDAMKRDNIIFPFRERRDALPVGKDEVQPGFDNPLHRTL